MGEKSGCEWVGEEGEDGFQGEGNKNCEAVREAPGKGRKNQS